MINKYYNEVVIDILQEYICILNNIDRNINLQIAIEYDKSRKY